MLSFGRRSEYCAAPVSAVRSLAETERWFTVDDPTAQPLSQVQTANAPHTTRQR